MSVLKDKRHIFFCGHGIASCVASEGALKMKELTYLHCQSITLYDLSNNFYTYFKREKNSPIIFIILDKQADKAHMMDTIEDMKAKLQILPIIISDIRDGETRTRLQKMADDRVMFVQRSGWALSALLCVVPLQRLSYDLTIALGYHPDKPRNLAKELTTQ